jgi:pyridoxamine 5'-phosphate oxidase
MGRTLIRSIRVMTDEEFLHRFETADLAEFRHGDHVRAAWAYVERDGPDRALGAMLGGIRRFANAKGAPGKFHYTLTRAWLALIVDARVRYPHARTAAALLDACPLLGDTRALERFYSSETLGSDRARAEWVEPDRGPLTSSPSASGLFMPDPDPFTWFANAIERAQGLGVDTAPTALATADAHGRPSVRMVLMRGADGRGFAFHTNYSSRKARDLIENAHAALCLYWPTLEEQIRIEGTVVRLPADESDAYFAGRPRASQIGAWASEQSAVLPDRAVLEERVRSVEARFDGQPVPRPPFWGGFRVIPERIEFWYGRQDRLHDRIVYVREGEGWRIERLFP